MQDTPTFSDRGVGGLDDFDAFREKKFNFLYLCKSCARSFDSISVMQTCKYCNSPVEELEAKQKHPLLTESYYRYYCPRCEKNYKHSGKRVECQICGSRVISFYKWEDIPLKDKIMLKIFRKIKEKKTDENTKMKKHLIF